MANRSSVWLSLTLDKRGQRAQQVFRALKLAIEQRHLLSGQRLPSSSQLATDLGCSRVTVETAYQRLNDVGYVQRQRGRGSFVSFYPPLALASSTSHLPLPFSNRGLNHLTATVCNDPNQPTAFNAGIPDLRAFPYARWAEISRQVHSQLTPELLGYGDPQGLPSLRRAVAHYLVLSRQLNCHPDHVLILNSSQQALQLLALMLLDPGDRVMTEALCYPGAVNAFRQAGATLIAQVIDDQGAKVPSEAAKLAYLTPSHQYPLGMTMSAERRQQWLDWAAMHDSWIIEDDYDGEFHYSDTPASSLQKIDRAQRVIYLGTFSKTLFPSLRLAYMVIPPQLTSSFVKARQLLDGHSTQITQAIVSEFIIQGDFAHHLRLMKTLYAARRDLLLSLLQQAGRHDLRVIPANGGLQLAVEYLGGETQAITQQARQVGLQLIELAPLSLTSPVLQGWIIGFSALTPNEIKRAMAQFMTVLQNATSSNSSKSLKTH